MSFMRSLVFLSPRSLAKSSPFLCMVSFLHVREQNIGSGLIARRTVLRQAYPSLPISLDIPHLISGRNETDQMVLEDAPLNCVTFFSTGGISF